MLYTSHSDGSVTSAEICILTTLQNTYVSQLRGMTHQVSYKAHVQVVGELDAVGLHVTNTSKVLYLKQQFLCLISCQSMADQGHFEGGATCKVIHGGRPRYQRRM